MPQTSNFESSWRFALLVQGANVPQVVETGCLKGEIL